MTQRMSNLMGVITGIGAPFQRDNVDAMTIAPRTAAEKGGAKTQGGPETVGPEALFAHLRFADDGSERPDFVLNRPEFSQAKFLIARRSFGCGSAREHAVWALTNFGIRCVIAESFGPLFYGNCFKNGLLPVMLPLAEVTRLAEEASAGGALAMFSADIPRQQITTPAGRIVAFELPAFRLKQLVEGLDEIELSLRVVDKITAFHAAARKARPWVYRQT